MKYAEKSVPDLADVGVPNGDGDGPRTPPRCLEGVRKKFQMTNLTVGWPKVPQSQKTFRDTSPTRLFCQIDEKNAVKHPKN